jgi:hypothetical protein
MQIEIDFDVHKAITARRKTESITPNDVLREMFKLPPKSTRSSSGSGDGVFYKGVHFPEGTQFRATYKGKTFRTEIRNGAYQDRDGVEYSSPSQAAFAFTKVSVNGWKFWECQRPGEAKWQVIDGLRPRNI